MERNVKRMVMLCGVLAAGFVLAAPGELETLKAGRAAEKARLDSALAQQKTNALTGYRQAVDAQMLVVKKQGNLDGYLELEAEKKRIAAENSVNTNDTPALAPLVAQYQKVLQDVTGAYGKAVISSQRQYVLRLTTLMQNYTRADKLDDALLVRDELQGARTELTFLEADAPAEAAKPPAPAPSPSPAPASAAESLTNALAGTWSITWRNAGKSGSDAITLNPDGTASCPKEDAVGTWLIRERQCIIRWAKTENVLTISEDGKHMMGHTRQGVALTAVKSGQ